nr:MAG TPA: hypothetical protein [Caudoviricetes sp.]
MFSSHFPLDSVNLTCQRSIYTVHHCISPD